MTTYQAAALPRLWWLNPWLHVRRLHSAVGALNTFVCELDERNTELICQTHKVQVEALRKRDDANNTIDRLQKELDYTELRREGLSRDVAKCRQGLCRKKPTPKRKRK